MVSFYIAWLVLLLATVLWDFSGLDVLVSQQIGTPQGFALRGHWFFEGVMHNGARLVAWWVFASMVLASWIAVDSQARTHLLWAIAVTVMATFLVLWIKRTSMTSCPWDLKAFGGAANYVSHWSGQLNDGGVGRCFPSGHATSAFCFLPAWVVLQGYLSRPKTVLLSLIGAGLLLGAIQVIRGAHFVSHVLWSGSICLTCGAVLGLLTGALRPSGFAIER